MLLLYCLYRGHLFPHSWDPRHPCLHHPAYSFNPNDLSIHFPASSVPSVAQASPLGATLTASADGEGLNPLQEPYLIGSSSQAACTLTAPYF